GWSRLAAPRNGRYHHWTIKGSRGHQPGIRDRNVALHQTRSHVAEEIVPRNLLRARDIVREEPSQIGMAHRFGSLAHAIRIRKEPSFLRVILIHPLKDVAQRCLPVARLAP